MKSVRLLTAIMLRELLMACSGSGTPECTSLTNRPKFPGALGP